MLVLGGAAGVLSGMFGIGGGLVIVPALVLIFGFDIKTAIGTSLFVILLPTGLLGVLEYHKNAQLKMPAGLLIALGVFVGAYFGAKLSGAHLGDDDEAVLCRLSSARRLLFPAFADARAETPPTPWKSFRPPRKVPPRPDVSSAAQAVHCPPDLSW